MFIAIFTLVLIIGLAVVGLTGVGAYDSRDAGFSLRRRYGASRCAVDDLVAPQQHRSVRAALSTRLQLR
jgi:hypothetical protein